MMNLRNSPRLAYCGAWALAGLYNFCRDMFSAPWGMLFVFNTAHFSVWAVLGLIAIPIIRHYPLRLHWRPWIFHLLMGALFAQADTTLAHWIYAFVMDAFKGQSLFDIAVIAFKSCFHLALLTYGCLLGVVQGLDTQKLARMREVQAAEHKAAFIHAQLESLKIQLQPHFLFNTLNAIASTMHYDVATADRMLNRLSELLRISLREADSPVVSLKQEITFVEAYLEIEKIRFEHRLNVTWSVPDTLHDHPIPSFILQPLVENAIKYGVAPRAAGGNITIRAYTDDRGLLLEVENDAPETPQQQKSIENGFGIGLSNTRSRLEALYGAAQRLELIRSGTGTIARIRIPLFQPLAMAA